LSASPNNWIAHYAKGQLLRVQRRCADAIPEYETVLAYNRNAGGALSHIARCKMFLGLMEEVIPLLEQAIRLSPRDPDTYAFYQLLGRAHLLQSRTDEAIVWAERSRSTHPGNPFLHAELAAAYALKGKTDHADAELAEARRLGGAGYLPSIARLRTDPRYETPASRALNEATFFTGLRKAGVPEE
jgi:tetratricopeptide (TPR) repeat protein